jgi:DNA-binding NarL/FixJ family response regulator
MNVLIATGNRLLSKGLMQLLTNHNGTKHKFHTTDASLNTSPSTWTSHDVILTDYSSISRIPKESFDKSKVLVLDAGLEKDTIVTLYLTENISGLIPADSDVSMLLKAIKAVQKGEIWIDNQTIKLLLDKKISRKTRQVAKLTEREHAITKLVAEGYRNKEIAAFLSISEQTVKSHLNRVFRKSNVSTRTELLAKIHAQA